ncbi:IclR family transcriptional regulator [Nocardioides glacieisoli]|uniref:IclR family transcriptional regulator n=1 Tax=Nocardioides glacieisoli TaxID=1168730 RepID=UPI0013ED7587|nr:IclR family transcriptional regulator [Nocardioides glacieisoli]
MDADDVVVSDDGRRLRPVKSLLRALDVLDALGAADGPLTLNELVTHTGLSRTAAYNIAATYELRGLVRRDTQNRYGLGWGLLELGEQVRARSELGDAARPVVEDLAEVTGETVLLGVLDQDSVIYIEKAESRRSVRMVEAPGRRLPLHETATGLVLLAYASAPFRDRYLLGLDADGAQRADRLGEVTSTIRRSGHAVSVQDLDPDLTSASAPVSGPGDKVVAALTIAGPASRLTRDRIEEFVPRLIAAADEIASLLGS